jgi:GxxExxY protein
MESKMPLLHASITEKVLGSAMTVLNNLRPGLDEHFYEQALVLELDLLGIQSDRQKAYAVTYKGHNLGKLIPDLIVEGGR